MDSIQMLVCTIMVLLFAEGISCDQKSKNAAKGKIDDISKKLNDSKSTPKHPKIEEYSKNAHMRPTKCQVCRVLAEELEIEVHKTSDKTHSLWLSNRLDGEDKKDEKKGLKIDYKTSELRLMDILENVCNNVYEYRSIAGPDFPYLKGVKSMFRQQLEEMMGEHKVSVKLDAPEEIVEDPTFELRRMQYQCNQMIEEHEDDILDWYMHKQDTPPLEFLCEERIIKPKAQDCLHASTFIPDFATEPKPSDDENKQTFHNGPSMEL